MCLPQTLLASLNIIFLELHLVYNYFGSYFVNSIMKYVDEPQKWIIIWAHSAS